MHERAWVVVLDGDVEITSATGERASGGNGLMVELAATERHEVVAHTDARLLLLLAPWPGKGHPGAMTIRQKLYARRRAAKNEVARRRLPELNAVVAEPSLSHGSSVREHAAVWVVVADEYLTRFVARCDARIVERTAI